MTQIYVECDGIDCITDPVYCENINSLKELIKQGWIFEYNSLNKLLLTLVYCSKCAKFISNKKL